MSGSKRWRIKWPKSTIKMRLTITAGKYQTRWQTNKAITSIKKHMKQEV